MLPFVKFAGVVGVFAVTMISGVGWWYAVAPPPPAQLSLPSPLLDAGSEEGRFMLASTPFRVDYDLLSKYFVAQNRRGYCGVASGTMVLNALHPSAAPLSQELFFTERAAAVRNSVRVTLGGMTLSQLADLLRAHDLNVSAVYASDTNLETFRKAAREKLHDRTDFVLVNYDRVTLHQNGGGHISPLAAYHPATDRFLVLDVASHSYPPTWIPATELWKAMNTIDLSSGGSRGYLLVRSGVDGHGIATDPPATP